ncbi:MAG: DUF3052 domain-containing protein [Actinomycetota bacterium]|nr:DUF3052 domain-containing protein [Actinomycetota bacterium]
MSATAGPAEGQRSGAGKLGIAPGAVVQELGYDDDADEELRQSVMDTVEADFVEADHDGVVDVVLLWWREDDGDLVDALVDALTPLTAGGAIWVLTPKAGRDGHVEPSDIAEAAQTAGLTQTRSINAAAEWSGARLVSRGARR